jgi:drug/metabolite transporter (DMT)-like permease
MSISVDSSISETTAPVKPWTIGGFALLCLCWGATWLPLKHGVAQLPPLLFVASRFLAGGLVLWLAAGCPRPPAARMLWTGAILMIAANYGLMAWGVGRVASGLAATVNLATVPLAVLVFTARRPRPGQVAALMLGAVGLVALGLTTDPQLSGASVGLGAIALGSACYGFGTVRMKAMASTLSPVAVAAWHSLAGGALLLALSGMIEPWNAGVWNRFMAPEALLNWALLVLLSTIIGFTLYLALLRHWSASAVAGYAYICPVIALALGAAIEGERPDLVQWLASLLLIGAAGLALISKPQETP